MVTTKELRALVESVIQPIAIWNARDVGGDDAHVTFSDFDVVHG
jgi:hypothetical protein